MRDEKLYSKALFHFKVALLCFIVVALIGVNTLARAESVTVDSVEDGVVTLSNGTTLSVEDSSPIAVGDDVEIDSTYTIEASNGETIEAEEY